ncbi:MAG: hypothetical protein Q9165_007939 [Trypethelium subeluteriae]
MATILRLRNNITTLPRGVSTTRASPRSPRSNRPNRPQRSYRADPRGRTRRSAAPSPASSSPGPITTTTTTAADTTPPSLPPVAPNPPTAGTPNTPTTGTPDVATTDTSSAPSTPTPIRSSPPTSRVLRVGSPRGGVSPRVEKKRKRERGRAALRSVGGMGTEEKDLRLKLWREMGGERQWRVETEWVVPRRVRVEREREREREVEREEEERGREG